MYHLKSYLSLTILGLFLATNVCGLPDYCRNPKFSLYCNNLAVIKNQTKISKEATENTITHPILSIESLDHPNHGELKNVLCMYVRGLDFDLKFVYCLGNVQ